MVRWRARLGYSRAGADVLILNEEQPGLPVVAWGAGQADGVGSRGDARTSAAWPAPSEPHLDFQPQLDVWLEKAGAREHKTLGTRPIEKLIEERGGDAGAGRAHTQSSTPVRPGTRLTLFPSSQ